VGRSIGAVDMGSDGGSQLTERGRTDLCTWTRGNLACGTTSARRWRARKMDGGVRHDAWRRGARPSVRYLAVVACVVDDDRRTEQVGSVALR
jgi:hypothetical protein